MSSDAERAETARQQGNVLYKSSRMNEAIQAYHVARALTPSDPTPLSNLSAATFEVGDYEKSVKFTNEALVLLKEEPDDDPRKLKLLKRLTKAKLYHSEPEDSIAKKSLRDAIFQLPRYRPYLNDERGHYPVGHDTPSSQYGPALKETTKDVQAVSILFCGIGDARHLYQTMMEYVQRDPKSDQRLCFTILDYKPAMLARDLILFSLLDDLSQAMRPLTHDYQRSASQEERARILETLSVITYLFVTQVIPGYAWDRLQATIQRLLDSFSRCEQPISWVHVPVVVQDAVRRALESWKPVPTGSYSTERFRKLTSAENLRETFMMAQMSLFMEVDQDEPLAHLDFEHRVYKDFSIILPRKDLMEAYDPELAAIVHEYQERDDDARLRLSAHINRKWKPNITLADIEWESENAVPGFAPIPDLSFTPFSIVKTLLGACVNDPQLEALSPDTLFSVTDMYFMMIADAITTLRDRMMIEVCLGEMADVLERMRYQAIDRSVDPTSKRGLKSSKWSEKYHVIHMSNIPDYVGGPLTSFLYGAPILEHGPGTGIVSCVLRNTPRWQSVPQFLSEHLLMYNRELIQSHFQLKQSPDTPKEGAYRFPLGGYFLWMPIPQQPLTFEELMPQANFLHWMHAHFLKLCIPYPRPVFDPQPIYAPLNMTAFLRLIMHVSELGYPTHWLSNLTECILSGEITTTARPPGQMILDPSDVDKVHPAKTFCTRPWTLELATLAGLWRGILPSGLVSSTAVPQARDIVQYTIAFPDLQIHEHRVPHSMLIFYDKQKFGKPPRNLRTLLLDNAEVSGPSSQAIREKGIHCLSTFTWKENIKEITFWMGKETFDEMVEWRGYVCKADLWERNGKGVKLGEAVVKRRCWGEWEDPPMKL